MLLEDNPNALWKRAEMIDAHRVLECPPLVRVAVAIDPPATSDEDAAEAGIIAGGVDARVVRTRRRGLGDRDIRQGDEPHGKANRVE